MKLLISYVFGVFVVLTVCPSAFAIAVPAVTNRKPTKQFKLASTVRAERCIANSTHCHCATTRASGGTCYRPEMKDSNICAESTCSAGLRCDCASDRICLKSEVTRYKLTEEVRDGRAGCESSKVLAPTKVLGFTADFEISVYDSFNLYVDGKVVGSGSGGGKTYTTTSELNAGSVIGLEVWRENNALPCSAKLRYLIHGTTHTLDE